MERKMFQVTKNTTELNGAKLRLFRHLDLDDGPCVVGRCDEFGENEILFESPDEDAAMAKAAEYENSYDFDRGEVTEITVDAVIETRESAEDDWEFSELIGGDWTNRAAKDWETAWQKYHRNDVMAWFCRLPVADILAVIKKIAPNATLSRDKWGEWTLDTGDGEPLEGFDLPALLDDSYMSDDIADIINDDAALWEKVKNA